MSLYLLAKFERKDHFMIIGYGRTSTIEQVAGLEAQIRDLKAAGAENYSRERQLGRAASTA